MRPDDFIVMPLKIAEPRDTPGRRLIERAQRAEALAFLRRAGYIK